MKRRPTSIRTTLAGSALALTLIAPWAFGQGPDPFTEIRRLAEQGDADAQYNLGYRYSTGIGVPQDRAEAARWLRLAASQGHVQAQHFLERILPEGGRVPEGDAEAVRGRQAAGQLSVLVRTGTAQEGTSQQLTAASRLQCEFNIVVTGKWDENGKISTEVTTQTFNLLFSNIQDESATMRGNQGENDVLVLKREGTLNMIEITPTMLHLTTVFDTIVNGRFLAVHSRHSHLLHLQAFVDTPAVTPSQQYGHCTLR